MTTCQHCGGPLDTAGGCHCLVGRNAVAAAVPIPAVIATGCPRCSAVVVVPLPAGATAAEARAERAERERDEARGEVARLREEVEDWRESSHRVMAEECAPDERHCTCVPTLRAEVERLTRELASAVRRARAKSEGR